MTLSTLGTARRRSVEAGWVAEEYKCCKKGWLWRRYSEGPGARCRHCRLRMPCGVQRQTRQQCGRSS